MMLYIPVCIGEKGRRKKFHGKPTKLKIEPERLMNNNYLCPFSQQDDPFHFIVGRRWMKFPLNQRIRFRFTWSLNYKGCGK